MAELTIRELDPEIVRELVRRAAENGRDLQQEVRSILKEATRPSRADFLEDARRIRGMSPPVTLDIEELVREDRDSR